MLSSGHQSLVDDFCGIVATGINVNALLDDGVGTGTKRLADFVPAGLDLR